MKCGKTSRLGENKWSYSVSYFVMFQVQTVFNLFLSMSKEEFRKMNHVHPVGETRAIIEDLGAEVRQAELILTEVPAAS